MKKFKILLAFAISFSTLLRASENQQSQNSSQNMMQMGMMAPMAMQFLGGGHGSSKTTANQAPARPSTQAPMTKPGESANYAQAPARPTTEAPRNKPTEAQAGENYMENYMNEEPISSQQMENLYNQGAFNATRVNPETGNYEPYNQVTGEYGEGAFNANKYTPQYNPNSNPNLSEQAPARPTTEAPMNTPYEAENYGGQNVAQGGSQYQENLPASQQRFNASESTEAYEPITGARTGAASNAELQGIMNEGQQNLPSYMRPTANTTNAAATESEGLLTPTNESNSLFTSNASGEANGLFTSNASQAGEAAEAGASEAGEAGEVASGLGEAGEAASGLGEAEGILGTIEEIAPLAEMAAI